MNEQTLAREFALAVTKEPPLGFDPDDVVTRAALRYRRRRANISVGFGIVAVAGAAFAVPLGFGHSTAGADGVSTAGPAASGAVASSPVAGSARWPTSSTTLRRKPTDAQLTATGAAIKRHLLSVLPAMSAGARVAAPPTVTKGEFGALELPELEQEPGVSVDFSMTSPNGPFYVDVDVDALPATAHSFTLGDVCAAARHQIDPAIDCAYAQRTDGTLVLTMNQHGENSKRGPKSAVIWVTSYRPDGLMVTVTTDYGSRRTDALPLTEAQVTDLATDPAITMAK